MPDETKVHCRSTDFGAIVGPIWGLGWLFTIGFLGLSFWKAAMAIVLWPYYLGVFFGK